MATIIQTRVDLPAFQTGYRGFWQGELMGDGNPYDPHKRDYSLWEDGWHRGWAEAFATGALAFAGGKPRQNPWDAGSDEPMTQAFDAGYDWLTSR